MATFVHSFSSRTVLCVDREKYTTVGDLKKYLISEKGLDTSSFYLICNGKIVEDNEPVKKDAVYQTHLRLPGGKGGFGSMLRAIGAQIEKTTNHEACRDLSGRRMRDINNEKELKEWLAKQAEREREREQKRQERIARRRAMPNHKFSDPLYDEQKALLAEMQEDALQTGLKKAFTKPSSSASCTVTSEEPPSSKRKAETEGPSCSGTSKKKKAAEWLGLDIDNLSDLDSDDDETDNKEASSGSASNSNSEDNNSKSSDNFPVKEENATNTADNLNCKSDIAKIDVNTGEERGFEQSKGNIAEIKHEAEVDQKTNGILEESAAESAVKTDLSGSDVDCKPFNLDEVTCIDDVLKLGLDRLKQELIDRGLKCGGTLEQRADRLYSVKGLTKDQIDPALFAKSANGKKVKTRK